MKKYFDTVSAGNGDPLSGAMVRVLNNADSTLATIYADVGGTPLANPVTTDSLGYFEFYVVDGDYNIEYLYAGSVLKRITDVPIYRSGPQGNKGDPGGNASAIGPFTAISGLAIAAGYDAIETSEYRAGTAKGAGRYLRWKAPLAALPAVGAGENAWWAQSLDGASWYPDSEQIHIYHFGLYGNAAQYGNDPSADHDDLPAFKAFRSYCLWARTNVNAKTATLPKLRLPGTTAYSSGTWEFNFGTANLEGPTAGGEEGGHGFSLCFAGGVDGIIVDKDITTGGTTRASVPGGQGSTFKNMEVWTRSAGGSTTACGIRLRTRAFLENFSAWNFPQDGLCDNTTSGSGGATEGEASMVRVIGGEFHNNGRDGARFQGGDSQVALLMNVTFYENGEWGYGGRDFLGNTVIACHSKSNARRGESGPTYAAKTSVTSVSYGGNVYSVRFGQEAGASTNAPTGTATSNTWWVYRGAGAPSTLNPLWVSGTTIVSGGAYLAADGNSRSVFVGCYSESDHPGSWLSSTSMAIGGLHAAGIQGNFLQATNGLFTVSQGIGLSYTEDSGSITNIHLGSAVEPLDPSVLAEFGRNVSGLNDWRWKINAGQDWLFDYQGLGGSSPFWVMGPGRTQADDRYRAAFVDMLLGSTDDTSSIKLGASTAMPSTGYYRSGSFVHSKGATVSAGKILLGWKRLVTGSAHVLNTDWCACYATTT